MNLYHWMFLNCNGHSVSEFEGDRDLKITKWDFPQKRTQNPAWWTMAILRTTWTFFRFPDPKGLNMKYGYSFRGDKYKGYTIFGVNYDYYFIKWCKKKKKRIFHVWWSYKIYIFHFIQWNKSHSQVLQKFEFTFYYIQNLLKKRSNSNILLCNIRFDLQFHPLAVIYKDLAVKYKNF